MPVQTAKNKTTELREYRTTIKALDFKGKVKAYFDTLPTKDPLASKKKDIVIASFTRKEKDKFATDYYPLYEVIGEHTDKIRSVQAYIDFYSFYIESFLRDYDIVTYTADFLNLRIEKLKEAKKEVTDKKTKKLLDEVLGDMSGYKKLVITSPEIKVGRNGKYKVDSASNLQNIGKVTKDIIRLLSDVKSYIYSLKEFLDYIQQPDLFPLEYSLIEEKYREKFTADPAKGIRYLDGEKEYPQLFTPMRGEKEYLDIDFSKLPRTKFLDYNPFMNSLDRRMSF